MQAQIIKIVSKDYTLYTENGEKVNAVLAGRLRLQMKPVTGDYVICENHQDAWYVVEILPRKNYLVRPPIANCDQALIVMSTVDPDFSTTLIDRLSILIMHAQIQPILIVSKCDLPKTAETEEHIREYERGQMPVIRTSKKEPNEALPKLLAGHVSVLTGQSGAGKSSLINTLDPSFQLATQEISKALGRGKHTTRHNELHLVCGGLVADTPGFSSLDFHAIGEEELAYDIPDFLPYLGHCRFNDCRHENEPDCGIKAAVEQGEICRDRYNNYLGVLKWIREEKKKYL